jgi:hypothetical protein
MKRDLERCLRAGSRPTKRVDHLGLTLSYIKTNKTRGVIFIRLDHSVVRPETYRPDRRHERAIRQHAAPGARFASAKKSVHGGPAELSKCPTC